MFSDKSEGGIWKREAEIPVTGKPEQGYFIDILLGRLLFNTLSDNIINYSYEITNLGLLHECEN